MPDREVTVGMCNAQGLHQCRTIQKTHLTLLFGLLLSLTLGAQAQRVTGVIPNYALLRTGHGVPRPPQRSEHRNHRGRGHGD